jgi:choline dehydrogenase
VKFALLEGQLLSQELDRATFVARAADLGLPAPAVTNAADKFLAISAHQTARRANMLADPRDLAALRRSMEITRELGNSEVMQPFVKREILPGDRKGEALDDLIRDGAMSMHHPTCTAKMGQDDLSVVDAKLRVYGVKNLRIADGSIMPTITTGNNHAPCVIIGERLAEILTV